MMLLKILPSLSNPYSPRSFGFTAVKLLPNVGMFYSDGKFTCDENLYEYLPASGMSTHFQLFKGIFYDRPTRLSTVRR